MASTSTDILDGVSSSLAVKAPVRVATTAAITLSGLQTIDGVTVAAGDRVLVKNQADPIENGIYKVSASAWLRAADFNGARDVVQGTIVNVTSGTLNAGYFFSVTTASPVIGTTAIAWVDAALNVNATITAMVSAAQAAQVAAQAAQVAAEAAAASSSYLSTGLGATAGISVLVSLDATNTASGYTRYDNTTAGTFPTGVTKADGGIVATYRRTSASLWQNLYAFTTGVTYERSYNGSSFTPWRSLSGMMLWQQGSITPGATFDTTQIPQNWVEAELTLSQFSLSGAGDFRIQCFTSGGAAPLLTTMWSLDLGGGLTSKSDGSNILLVMPAGSTVGQAKVTLRREASAPGAHRIFGECTGNNTVGRQFFGNFETSAVVPNSSTEGPGFRISASTGTIDAGIFAVRWE